MFIRIESASGIPITRQIMDQIRDQYASGSLKAGDRLPSVRELARDLAVNQNTILKVYERLTMEGLLECRHGDGTYISDTPPAKSISGAKLKLAEDVQRFVRRAHTLGLDLKGIHQLVDEVHRAMKPSLKR